MRNVQVIPSVDEAAVVVEPTPATATNVLLVFGKIPILNVSATADVFVILIDFIIVDVVDGTE